MVQSEKPHGQEFDLEAAADQAIAACQGDLRATIKSLAGNGVH